MALSHQTVWVHICIDIAQLMLLSLLYVHGITTPATWQRRIASLKRIFWKVACQKSIFMALPRCIKMSTHNGLHEVEIALQMHQPCFMGLLRVALFLI